MKKILWMRMFLVMGVGILSANGPYRAEAAEEPPIIVSPTGIYKVEMAENPPVIDGKLDDAIWQRVNAFTDFKTFKPDFGKDASEKTGAYMAYDAESLYFGFNCLDSDPGKVKASMSKRDNIDADDWVGIALDTFNDHQSGYLFVANPLGIQMDGTLSPDGNGDGSFDTVWKSQGRINGTGYTVEMAIPWKSIRFPYRKKLVMGIGFVRVLSRKSEQISFPALSPDKGALLSQLQPFEVSGIKYKRTVEAIPAVTFARSGEHEAGKFSMNKGKGDFSLTGKLGITSDLTLDATYNPDFSQVEADASQIDVNLRYALYYPEKRPFFLEGLENFGFGARMEANPLGAIVHTRTIVDPVMGFKLNGKIGRRDMASFIFALDEYPGAVAAEEGDADQAGRNAAFTIFRYRRSLSKDSYIGGFLTDRDFVGSYNRLAGADGRLRLNGKSFLEYHFFESFSKDNGEPGSASGSALGLRYAYSTRTWNIETGYVDIGKSFRTDVGYLTRAGIRTIPFFAMYSIYPRSKFFQKIEPFYWATHSWDTYSNLFESFNIFVIRFSMPRNSQVRFDAILGNEVFAERRFNRNGFRILGYTQIVKQLYLEALVRYGRAIYYDPDAPYPGHGTSAYLGVIFQPTEKLKSTMSMNYSDFFRESNGEKIYDYTIVRDSTVFQFNKYLFLRGILEYNFYWKHLSADFLASFTYIPGTVIYLGYGSAYEKVRWDGSDYVSADDFLTTKKSFFFKASYLWRL